MAFGGGGAGADTALVCLNVAGVSSKTIHVTLPFTCVSSM